MVVRSNGAKLSIYFDRDLWKEMDFHVCKSGLTPNDFVRQAVRKYISSQTLEEIEKLQALNARMFKYLANKLSHVEMLTAIAKEELGVGEKLSSLEYDEKLNAVKSFNQSAIEKIIDESL